MVAEAIVMAYKRNKWQQEWFLVEALHTADLATIVVSEDSKAGLVLAATVEAPLIAISLADPKISLSVTSVSGKIIHLVGAHEDRKSTRLNSSHIQKSRMPSSA